MAQRPRAKSPARPTKEALRDELAAQLAEDLESMERAQRATMAGATHAEAKPENDKDTRALEQSYLARGQATRVAELREALAAVQSMPVAALPEDAPAALGALVTAEHDDGEMQVFLAPQGGGKHVHGGKVQVVTPQSPLGRALVGQRAGDTCELRAAGRVRELSIVGVR